MHVDERSAEPALQTDLQELLQVSQDLIALAGQDGRLTWVNLSWEAVLGWTVEELCGKQFIEFVHPADVQSTLEQAARLAQGHPTSSFENRYRCKDGTYRWLSWNTTPRTDGTLFCIVRDVTPIHEERRAKQARIRQLELAESLLKVGNWRVDLTRGSVHWSPEVYRIHGYDPESYTPTLDAAIEAYHPDDRPRVESAMEQAVQERGSFSFSLRLIRADTGEERLVRSSGTVQCSDEGEAVGIIGVFQDVTELTIRERQLREANDSLEGRMAELEERSEMMQTMSELGDMLQSAIDVEESKDVLRALLPRIFRGLSGVLYLRDNKTDHHLRAASWGTMLGAWRKADPGSCWAVRRGTPHTVKRDGMLRCRHLHGVPGGSRCVPLMAHGQLVGLLVIAAGTPTEEVRLRGLGTFPETVADQIALAVSNVRLRDRLREQSLRDQLTGLYNRRFFDDWLAKHLANARRTEGLVSLAMLDLDHFKRFNDTHGHITADRLLAGFANLLEGHVREGDVVCRWGGEEFLLATPHCDAEQLQMVVERIQASLKELRVPDDAGRRVTPPTLSAGISAYPTDGHDSGTLLNAADRALYAAKDAGRNCVVKFAAMNASDRAA